MRWLKTLCVCLSLFQLHWANGLDWQAGQGFRFTPVQVPPGGKAEFTQLPPASTGITFTNRLARERFTTNQIYLNGSGVAAGDVDGDGLCDLFFCALDNANVLYRNLGGWKFADITAGAGVAGSNLDATGAAFADIDGDGDLDLIVNSINGGTHVFANDGRGRFAMLAQPAPLNPGKGGTSLALADIDGDGDLDLYVTNYRIDTVRDQPGTRFKGETINGTPVIMQVNGRRTTEPDLKGRFTMDPGGQIIEHGEVDVLFINDGTGRFTPRSFTDGTFLDENGHPLALPPNDWGLSAMFRDLNGDGAPDLYVCNDFRSPDRIWLNDGHGKFRAIARQALRHTSMFSMGVDFADVNRDGLDDFLVVDMLSRDHARRHAQVGDLLPAAPVLGGVSDRPQFSHNTLFVNRGDGTFAEIAFFAGLQASEWSWTPAFLDVDLDGYEDVLITTGHERDAMNADVMKRADELKASRKMSNAELLSLNNLFTRLDVGNVAFRNRGDLTFEDVSKAWGFDSPGVSHGLALADLDNDGDLDVAINRLNGPAGIYRNDASAPRLAVRLKGLSPNSRGIGARIKVRGGTVPLQSQEMICGGRYVSSDEPMRVFAARSAQSADIEITWRSGRRSVVRGAQADHIYELDEASAKPGEDLPPDNSNITPALASAQTPLFEDASHLLDHLHHEELFDDFARQPLLPNNLSQLGPGVAWHDLDADGWDDLIVGSGRNGTMAVFRNDRRGGFITVTNAPFNKPVSRDQTAILGLDSVLFVGSNNYEDGLPSGGAIRVYDATRNASGEAVLNQVASTGPLALGDADDDGDLDLFVGGRVLPGRYPEAANSLLLRNDNGRLVPLQRFEKLGLISAAVFSDLDGDGRLELVLACEWGPVRVFRREDGIFQEATQELGLAAHTGWWNGVATGDFDGDGRLDIVAANWGLNSRCQASAAHPRRIFFGDLGGRGTADIIESYFHAGFGKYVPERGLKAVRAALPFVLERAPTFESYGRMSVEDLLGDSFKQAGLLEAATLASTVFFNRGGRFEPVPLPAEAQWSPAFGVGVGDGDGDGHEDIFLSQNFFGTNPDVSRIDAGRGLWLRGDGRGAFTPLAGQHSGVKIYGEQRGCALSDFDGDGRVDLVAAQNGAATKLYRNTGARPGLRVRLQGPAGNTRGIGASLKLNLGGKWGPVRELQAGSGYWSQNSAVAVLSKPAGPVQLWIRWPGGKTTTNDVPAGALEVAVNAEGRLTKLR